MVGNQIVQSLHVFLKCGLRVIRSTDLQNKIVIHMLCTFFHYVLFTCLQTQMLCKTCKIWEHSINLIYYVIVKYLMKTFRKLQNIFVHK